MISRISQIKSYWFPDLSIRSNEIERMDDPTSCTVQLEQTLRHFAWINRIISRPSQFINACVDDMRKKSDQLFTFLDVGAGGGDIAIGLAKKCRSFSIDIKIVCLDSDPRVVAFAKRNCSTYQEIEVQRGDVYDLSSNNEQFDYVFANHLLHHFSTEAIPRLVEIISSRARRGFFLSDIARTSGAFFAYSLVSRLLLRNSFAFTDGRISIKKGFTQEEFKELMQKGIGRAVSIHSRFPWRLDAFGGAMYHE